MAGMTAEDHESGRVPRNAMLSEEAGRRTFVGSWIVVGVHGTTSVYISKRDGTVG